jgi:plastocyanin
MSAGFRFSPAQLTIAVGETVVVSNADSDHHTFTDSPTFDSGDVAPGAAYSYRFTTAGTYDFVCTYHSGAGMKGSITVR